MSTLGTRPMTAALALVAALSAGACSSTPAVAPPATSGPTVSGTAPGPVASGGSPSGTAAPAHAAGPSDGCDAPPAPPGSTEGTLMSGGVERKYHLDVPPGYDGRRPFALVFGLHALTVDYRIVPSMTGFPEMSAAHDVIGVAPSGLINGTTSYWNAAPVPDNPDVTFLAELLDHLEDTLCLDEGKVFSTGMSNGAQMSSLLACRMPERIAGIGPVSGVEFLEPCDGAPVPIMAFHGAEDPILPYTGGGLNATRIAELQRYQGQLPPGLPAPLGVDESMARWAAHNGCDPTPAEERVAPSIRHRTWQGCAARTELFIHEGGGHSWPGKPVPSFEAQFGKGTTEIDATALLTEFWLDDTTTAP